MGKNSIMLIPSKKSKTASLSVIKTSNASYKFLRKLLETLMKKYKTNRQKLKLNKSRGRQAERIHAIFLLFQICVPSVKLLCTSFKHYDWVVWCKIKLKFKEINNSSNLLIFCVFSTIKNIRMAK